MRKKPLVEGQEVFTAEWEWCRDEGLVVHRQFVLECRPDRLAIGESRRPESQTFLGFNHPGEGDHLCDTPREAVDRFLDWEIELAHDRIRGLRQEIKEKEARIRDLRKMDRTKFRIVKHADDWIPAYV